MHWGTFFIIFLAILSLPVYYFFDMVLNYDIRPEIRDDFCWGSSEKCVNDSRVENFRVKVTKKEIDYLKSILMENRDFTPPLEGTQTQYGLNEKPLNIIKKFIMNEYNFTERIKYLNTFPQFVTNIQGLNIHFIHVKSKNKNNRPVVPLLLLHGWPSAAREFYESIPILMDENRDVTINLVIPSLPGFGFSDGATKPNFRTAHMANIFKILMERLGYERFAVHGSDWGALVATNMAVLYPDKISGYHSSFCFSLRTKTLIKLVFGSIYPKLYMEERYVSKLYPLKDYIRFIFSESAYLHLMGTKPDTIGHILDRNPMGLITYLFEKLSVGKNKGNIFSPTGGLEDFDLTKIVDTILFYYWFPMKATTASRIYTENLSIGGLLEGLHNIPVSSKVPSYCAMFEHEFAFMPENFLRDKYENLVGYKVYPDIGHFAGIENNKLLTYDILSFVKNHVVSKNM